MYKCDTLFRPRHALNSLVESEAVWATPTPGLKRRRTWRPQGGQGSVTRHRTGRFTWGGLSTHSGRWSTLGRPAMGQSYVAPSIHSGRHTESYATHSIQFPPNKSPRSRLDSPTKSADAIYSCQRRWLPAAAVFNGSAATARRGPWPIFRAEVEAREPANGCHEVIRTVWLATLHIQLFC